MKLLLRAYVLLVAALFVASPAVAKTVYIVAIVPSDVGKVYITGNDPVLGMWNPHVAEMKADGTKRIFAIDAPKGAKVSYKFTLGSWDREALGEDGLPLTDNYTLTIGDQLYYRHVIPGFKGDPTQTVYVAAIVPDGTGPVYITGSTPALGPWNPHAVEMARDGKYRVYAFTAPRGTGLEYKFTLGSWATEALGSDGKPHQENYRLIVGAQQIYETNIAGFKSTP